MKKIFTTFLFICFITSAFAQQADSEEDLRKELTDTIEGWKKGGVVSLNLAQVSFSNWAAGGQNSVSATGLVNLYARYKKGDNIWENYLDIGYGSMKQGGADWFKTDDKIDLVSKFGRKAVPKWYYAGLLSFKTQMAPGYNIELANAKISNLLAPAYSIVALGLDYKPKENFTAYIAPVTAKVTIVNDQALADAGAFGVEKATYDTSGNKLTDGENIRTEFGGYIRVFHKLELMENITMQNKLDLFSNYLHNPLNIDISWELLIAMKVNKYISATLTTNLLYDDDIDIAIDSNNDGVIDKYGPRLQFKEVFGVGLSYTF